MPEDGDNNVRETDDQQQRGDANAGAGDQHQDKTFTEEQVNKIVQERLAREQKKYADYDDLKAKASKFDELDEQNKSELQKANDRAAKLERDLADATAAAQDSLLRSAVISEAAKRKVVDPDAALALVDRSLLEFGDDGSPTNIADAMDQLLKAKPYLVGGGTGTRGSADLGARGGDGKGQLGRDALKTMTPEQIVKARREGRFDALARGEA